MTDISRILAAAIGALQRGEGAWRVIVDRRTPVEIEAGDAEEMLTFFASARIALEEVERRLGDRAAEIAARRVDNGRQIQEVAVTLRGLCNAGSTPSPVATVLSEVALRLDGLAHLNPYAPQVISMTEVLRHRRGVPAAPAGGGGAA